MREKEAVISSKNEEIANMKNKMEVLHTHQRLRAEGGSGERCTAAHEHPPIFDSFPRTWRRSSATC